MGGGQCGWRSDVVVSEGGGQQPLEPGIEPLTLLQVRSINMTRTRVNK